ncbi:uncharacterized protein [Parasteatoda tepidariorum]|uniref:uncharacterized protein n=1 Tax=Parasteatoda tepidariorum TaxID=114398 RepID=UPI00077FD059|nr:uncharacterized protein LOC107448284 [Parasteatoda tepidariorum]
MMTTDDSDRSLQWMRFIPLVASFFFSLFGIFYSAWKQNFAATYTSLYLEIICVLLLRLHVLYMKNQLQQKAGRLTVKIIKILGIVGAFALLVVGGVLIYFAISQKQDFHWENKGWYVAAIPAFLGSFWSLILFFDCNKFETIYEQRYVNLN